MSAAPQHNGRKDASNASWLMPSGNATEVDIGVLTQWGHCDRHPDATAQSAVPDFKNTVSGDGTTF